MSSWKNFISNRSRYSLTSFFSSWSNKNKNSWENLWEEDVLSKAIWETEKKYDLNLSVSREKEQNIRTSYEIPSFRIARERPSMSQAALILKKNEGSVLLGRKGVLSDEQVEIIADSGERVLDLSLFDLTNYQLEILSYFQWDEIIFGFTKITDRQAEIFSKYRAWTLNLTNLLRISDYQLEMLMQLKWHKLNLRDLVPSRMQKTMLYRFQWKILNRAYAQRKEMNQKIIEEQRELKRLREERRKTRGVAYTSFQYA